MKPVERFLSGQAPLPGALRALPEPLCEMALRTGLWLRWRRHGERLRHNLQGFHTAIPPAAADRLLSRLAARMGAVAAAARQLEGPPAAWRGVAGASELEGRAREALDKGRGLVLACSHLGLWHLPLRLLDPIAPAWLLCPRSGSLRAAGELFLPAGLQRRSGSRPAHRDALAREALLQNQIVAVLCDLPAGSVRQEAVSFLGRQVCLPVTAAILARSAGAPLLPVFSPLGPASPVIEVSRFLDCGGAAAGRLTQELAREIGAAVHEHPDQWLGWLHRWNEPHRRRQSAARPAVPRHVALALS